MLRAVRTWIPVWRGLARDAPDRLWQTVWVLVGPLVNYALLIWFAANAQWGSSSDLTVDTAGVFIGLFVVVLRNSWNLLVEGATGTEAVAIGTGHGGPHGPPTNQSRSR